MKQAGIVAQGGEACSQGRGDPLASFDYVPEANIVTDCDPQNKPLETKYTAFKPVHKEDKVYYAPTQPSRHIYSSDYDADEERRVVLFTGTEVEDKIYP